MWVKVDTEITSFQTIFNTRSSNGIQIRRQKTNGRLYLELWGSSGTETRIYANTNILLNQWYHLVFTSDGTGQQSGMEIYVNDVLQPKVNLGGNDINTGTMLNAATSLKLMNYATQYTDGRLRNLRMWTNRVLSAGNVNALWHNGKYRMTEPHASDLILKLDMADAVWNGSEFDVADQSGLTAGAVSENMEAEDLVDDCP
jgi:hypothetical protein